MLEGINSWGQSEGAPERQSKGTENRGTFQVLEFGNGDQVRGGMPVWWGCAGYRMGGAGGAGPELGWQPTPTPLASHSL